jgi:hypothetical protein
MKRRWLSKYIIIVDRVLSLEPMPRKALVAPLSAVAHIHA